MTDTTTAPRTFEITGAWGSDSEQRREEYDRRSNIQGNDNPCVFCGRKVNPTRGFSVHMVHGGQYALHRDDETAYVSDGGDMGWWAIGSECAKRVPAEYRHAPEPTA